VPETGFQKFRRSTAISGGAPIVALSQRGLFSLNDVAFEKLDRPEALELFYNTDGIIGFKAAPKDSADSSVVRRHTKSSFQVEGRAFMRYWKIPEEAKGRRYRAELVEGVEGDILTVNLKEGNDHNEDGDR
jgi:hypothetical protein